MTEGRLKERGMGEELLPAGQGFAPPVPTSHMCLALHRSPHRHATHVVSAPNPTFCTQAFAPNLSHPTFRTRPFAPKFCTWWSMLLRPCLPRAPAGITHEVCASRCVSAACGCLHRTCPSLWCCVGAEARSQLVLTSAWAMT